MKSSFIFNFQFLIFNYLMNFIIIGIDDNGQQEFSREIRGHIASRTVFSGNVTTASCARSYRKVTAG